VSAAADAAAGTGRVGRLRAGVLLQPPGRSQRLAAPGLLCRIFTSMAVLCV
jgi:hypothetical protein